MPTNKLIKDFKRNNNQKGSGYSFNITRPIETTEDAEQLMKELNEEYNKGGL